jgi:hypothetical protein
MSLQQTAVAPTSSDASQIPSWTPEQIQTNLNNNQLLLAEWSLLLEKTGFIISSSSPVKKDKKLISLQKSSPQKKLRRLI